LTAAEDIHISRCRLPEPREETGWEEEDEDAAEEETAAAARKDTGSEVIMFEVSLDRSSTECVDK